MAFFKFRWPGQGEQKQTDKPVKRPRTTPQAETVEAMRRRARHRLIGAAVLVLIGVVGFPLLFDTQPRPIPVDIPIEIPDRNKVAPLVVPGPAVSSAPSATAAKPAVSAVAESGPASATTSARPAAAPPKGAVGAGLSDGEELVPPAARVPASRGAALPGTPKPEPKPEPKPPAPAEPKPAARPDDASRARALLEGRTMDTPAVAEEARFIVQVGAFADADKAREVRAKVERAGLKTYAQVVDTKDGKRTRVRVGPFGNRAEADKAAARVKALDLPASVLTL
ncbi:SPOR domain-containing protein [Acidovorax sp. RAC01]|uniref:SPOR domain-containing protein n=1 Tax=Acidovorax sp. RAC01 TaxID=1842533 RepID=UPI00083E6DAB|nr:SPOR domain-containing protein [Acidovorax sp. RAC01]AOG22359.1 sporulation related domain protein [Acidovorax sp. RAC01]